MRIFMLIFSGIVTLMAVTPNVYSRTAKSIDVRALPGEIFFIGWHTYGAERERDQLYLINANGSECQPLLPEMDRVSDLAVSPKLNKLTFYSSSDDESKNGRFVLNIEAPWKPEQLASRLQRPLPKDFPVKFQNSFTNYLWAIAFSPDGSLVAGSAGRGGYLHVANVKTGAVVAKVEGRFAKEGFPVSWSHDGATIVFIGCVFDNLCNEAELFIVDKDGGNLRQLTNNPRPYSWWTRLTAQPGQLRYKVQHHVNSPSWSPDGQWIVYGCFNDICKVRPDGSDATVIVKDAGHPTWSPDGKMIAYAAIRDDVPPLTREEAGGKAGIKPQNIYVCWADGTDETRITNNRLPPRNFTYHELNWVE